MKIKIQLRTRTTRTSRPRFPEVICFSHALNTVSGDAHFVTPNSKSFVVFAEDTNNNLFGRQPVYLSGKFPCPLDRLFFKIITKAEITQHLEESMVTGSASYIFNVISADTFLGSGCPWLWCFLLS